MNDWAWRLPFLLGGIIGGIAIFLRRRLPESQHFQKHHSDRSETSPLLQAFTTDRRKMIQAILFASAYGALFYIPIVYLPEWLHSQNGMPRDTTLQINSAATVLLFILIPVMGSISDRLIRRTHFIAGAMLLLGVAAYPAFSWLTDGAVWWKAGIVQLVLIIPMAVPLGAAPAMFVELFPARDRLSGYSVAYNLGLGIVGGATPMTATWLIKTTGMSAAPGGLLVAAAAIAVVAVLWIPDGSREPLPD